MAVRVLSTSDYAVIAVVLVLYIVIGVYYAWKERHAVSSRQFLSAEGQLGVIPVCLSLTACYMPSLAILGLLSEAYSHGLPMWITYSWMLFGAIVCNVIFLPIFYREKFTSINKYFLKRYNSNAIRMICSLISCLSLMFFMGVTLYVPAIAINSVTNIALWKIIVVIGLICTVYTTIGGLKAIIMTDNIQTVIMLTGLIIVLTKIMIDFGGIGEIWKIASDGNRIRLNNFNTDMFSSVPSMFHALFYGIVGFPTAVVTYQPGIQRICSMDSYKRARLVLFLNLPGSFVISGLGVFCGLALFAHYQSCDPLQNGQISSPDQLIPFFALEVLNYPVVPGLFLVCILSGALSNLASGNTALAAITCGDFLKPIFKFTGKKELYATKLTAAIFGIISIGLAFLCSNVKSIVQASAMLDFPLATALFSAYVTAALCPFANRKGTIVGILCGLVWCLVIGLGSVIVFSPQVQLDATRAVCNNNSTQNFSESTFANGTTSVDIADIPSGIMKIFHLSPYMMPCLSFAVTTFCILFFSLVTGGARDEPPVDPEFVYKPILKINSWNLSPTLKAILCPNVLQTTKKSSSVFDLQNASTEILFTEKTQNKK